MSDDDGDSRRALANSIAALLVAPVSDQPTTVRKCFFYNNFFIFVFSQWSITARIGVDF